MTTFTYSSGGHIQSIEDPSGRFATFTSSGSSLVAVEQADGSVTSYTYRSFAATKGFVEQKLRRAA